MADGLDIDSILARYGLAEVDVVRLLGVTHSAISYWRDGKRRPSPQTAIAAEEKLNIPRYELRPDLWPPPPGYRKPRKVPRPFRAPRVRPPSKS